MAQSMKSNEKKQIFTPAIVVTSDKWSQSCVVVSYDDEWFPPEWATERRDELQRDADEIGDETEIDYDTVEAEMVSEFESDNETVDNFWTEHGILCTESGNYYRYDTEGGSFAKYLGEYDSLDECLSDQD